MNPSCKPHAVCSNRQGYGVVRHDGKTQLLHRVVFCQANGVALGAIRGKVVRHTCDNPRCIEPRHLELGTQADNVRDMLTRGRQRFVPLAVRSGSENPMAKLDIDKAQAIRVEYAAGAKQKDLARKFSVSAALVSLVVNHKIWRDPAQRADVAPRKAA